MYVDGAVVHNAASAIDLDETAVIDGESDAAVDGEVARVIDCAAVVDGATGVLVDPNSELAVGGAISDLLTDHAKAAAMGKAGAAHALDFEWPAISRRVQDVMLGIAATRPA